MPTPFTHLRILQDLLADPELAPAHRALLRRRLPAFQLGSIVADARVSSGLKREATHFYAYGEPISEQPWRRMLRLHPALSRPSDQTHLAFLAGYVAHLAADEAWALKMVRTRFWGREWPGVDRRDKFFALHLILTVMDERDEAALYSWQAASLAGAEPCRWLPFLDDEILRGWRDMVARQIAPGGRSETLKIFSRRVQREPSEIRAALDDGGTMERCLWRHISRATLETVERQCYDYARAQLEIYLREFQRESQTPPGSEPLKALP